jgi:glycosyltransferase involved in cell wall biosynthesis
LTVDCGLFFIPLRILHISSARSLGGGERHLVDLVHGLAGRGHEVHVALRPGAMLREQFNVLPASHLVTLPLKNALDVRSASKLARIVRERRIEIVHAHMARDYPLAALATRRNKGVRLVITRHVLFPLSKLHALSLSHVSRVIAVSEPVARSLMKRRIFPAPKISVVSNGIDLEKFDAGLQGAARAGLCRKLGIDEGRLLVGTVGELNRLKGHEEFIRAAALVRARFERADFIVAGADASPTGERVAALERLIDELNLGGRVHLTGWVEDVAPLLSALDVFVSASRTESFGLAIVEAMASGAAIVATTTEGARSIIEDGVNGKLVAVGDVEELANNIVGLLTNADERRRLSESARRDARERFGLERMVEATEQIYLESLGELQA